MNSTMSSFSLISSVVEDAICSHFTPSPRKQKGAASAPPVSGSNSLKNINPIFPVTGSRYRNAPPNPAGSVILADENNGWPFGKIQYRSLGSILRTGRIFYARENAFPKKNYTACSFGIFDAHSSLLSTDCYLENITVSRH